MGNSSEFLDDNLLEVIDNLNIKRNALKKIIRKRFIKPLLIFLFFNFLILFCIVFISPVIFIFLIFFDFVVLIVFSSSYFGYTKEKSIRSFGNLSIDDDFYFCFPYISSYIHAKVNSYVSECKKSLFKPIIGTIIENVEYFPELFFNYEKVLESELFSELPKNQNITEKGEDYFPKTLMANNLDNNIKINFSGDDAIQGYLGKKYIEFCNLDISKIIKGERETTNYEIFHGLFLITDFKKIQFKTIVTATAFGKAIAKLKSFGKLLENLSLGVENSKEKTQLKKIELQNYMFNKHFSVFSEDEIEARKILTPIILENLGRFAEKYNRTINISFINNQIFFAFGIGPILEPSLQDLLPFRKIDKNSLKKDSCKIHQEIKLISEILMELRLFS